MSPLRELSTGVPGVVESGLTVTLYSHHSVTIQRCTKPCPTSYLHTAGQTKKEICFRWSGRVAKKRCDWRLFKKKFLLFATIFSYQTKENWIFFFLNCGRPTGHTYGHLLDRKPTYFCGQPHDSWSHHPHIHHIQAAWHIKK